MDLVEGQEMADLTANIKAEYNEMVENIAGIHILRKAIVQWVRPLNLIRRNY